MVTINQFSYFLGSLCSHNSSTVSVLTYPWLCVFWTFPMKGNLKERFWQMTRTPHKMAWRTSCALVGYAYPAPHVAPGVNGMAHVSKSSAYSIGLIQKKEDRIVVTRI